MTGQESLCALIERSGLVTDRRVVLFVEYGTHKTILPSEGQGITGHLRVSDQSTIDALREAFEKAGWKVKDS